MIVFAYSLDDLSLLIAILTILLFITSEMLFNPDYGRSVVINKQPIRKGAIYLGLIFIVLITIRLYRLVFLV